MAYTMGSLFAGIGGFDLGFERAGFKTSWQVEIDPYCQKVLAKNFPEAERFGDIRECGSHNLKPIDVICGGFPCQDISLIGARAGISGERSGLYRELVRTIRVVRPIYAVVENVAALLSDGMGVLLGDMAEVGYDTEWDCLPAAAFGAPHIRDRVFVVANANSDEHEVNPHEERRAPSTRILADAESESERESAAQVDSITDSRNARPFLGGGAWWATEPGICGVAYGVPDQVDRISGLGNAVVPQIPEMIARRIKQALEAA